MSLPDWQRKFRECAEMRDAALDREAGTADALQACDAALEAVGARVEKLEEGIRAALTELDSWLPSRSSALLRGHLADALGEP